MEVKDMRLESISVEDVVLDPKNPRFLHLELKGQSSLTQQAMIDEIKNDNATITLSKAIHREGVLNPIVVQPSRDGKYLVIDGNRRTVTVKLLLSEGAAPPLGKDLRKIPARVIPSEVSEIDIEVMKGVLQEGQKSWGRFNDAAYTRRLRHRHKMELDDIADRLQLSVRKVKQRLEDFDLYMQYTESTNDTDPDRFSYFADAPPKVRSWFKENDENLDKYFGLIAPNSKNQKIRSVTTAGGLRDFAKFIDDTEALEAFLTDPQVSVDDALAIARDNDLTLAAPFLKKVGKLAVQLKTLDDEQLAMIRSEPATKLELKRLGAAVSELLAKLDVKSRK